MQILALKEEKLKYNFSIQNISKENIKNYLKELGNNLNSKDSSLIKTVIQTFVKKIIVSKTSITLHIRLFPHMDIAKDGGADGNRTRVQN